MSNESFGSGAWERPTRPARPTQPPSKPPTRSYTAAEYYADQFDKDLAFSCATYNLFKAVSAFQEYERACDSYQTTKTSSETHEHEKAVYLAAKKYVATYEVANNE